MPGSPVLTKEDICDCYCPTLHSPKRIAPYYGIPVIADEVKWGSVKA